MLIIHKMSYYHRYFVFHATLTRCDFLFQILIPKRKCLCVISTYIDRYSCMHFMLLAILCTSHHKCRNYHGYEFVKLKYVHNISHRLISISADESEVTLTVLTQVLELIQEVTYLIYCNYKLHCIEWQHQD